MALKQMKVVTANCTSWKSIKKFLEKNGPQINDDGKQARCDADAVLVQEHHLRHKEIAGASVWALGHGWKSFWTPALPTEDGGTSAGVAILVRAEFGLIEKHVFEASTHRGLAGTFQYPGTPEIKLVSLYLESGSPLQGESGNLVKQVTAFLRNWAKPFIIGGDFNCTPCTLLKSRLIENLDAQVVAPSGPNCNTCKGQNGRSRVIDFFLVSVSLVKAVSSIRVVPKAGMSPHCPVAVSFEPRIGSMQVRKLMKAPKLPTKRIIGPLAKGKSWGRLLTIAQWAFWLACVSPSASAALDYLDFGFGQFIDQATDEILVATDTPFSKKGHRGKAIKCSWKPLISEGSECRGTNSVTMSNDEQVASTACDTAWATLEYSTTLRKAMNAVTDAPSEVVHIMSELENVTTNDERFKHINNELVTLANEFHDFRIQPASDSNALGIFGDSCTALVERARLGLAEAKHIVEQCSKDGFREWVRGNGAGDSANAFKFSKLPEQWRPDPVVGADKFTHDSIGRLDAERAKFKKLWSATDEPVPFGDDGGAYDDDGILLPPLTGDMLREAALSFSHGTASSYDGIHPRHYSLVCQEGLDVLALLLMTCEELGVWPDSLRSVVIALIPKAKGGTRPIGLFNGTHRLWTRSRKPVATAWENDNACSMFAAASGQAALDTVWAQSLRAETADGHNNVAAAALFDLKSFFDMVRHEHLGTRSRRTRFPMKLARLGIDGYRAPRYVQRGGCISSALHPARGIVAGCGLATTFVKIACLDVFKRLQARHPNVRFDAYIDDITIAAEGSEAEVILWIANASRDFVRTMQEEMGCEIAWEKAAVVSNCETVARRLRHSIGIPCIAEPVAANLGADFAAGRSRSKWGKFTSRSSRMKAAKKRKGRLQVLRTVLGGKRASLIATAGVLSAATYGAPVHGFSDNELRSLRRLVASSMTPSAQGRSLSALMLIRGDPTWRAAVAPISQWIRATWHAAHDHELVGRGITLDALTKAWLTDRSTRQGRLVSATGKSRWQRVKGPVDALELSMHRIGWTMQGPFVWKDDLGVSRSLLEHSPALWNILLKDAVHRYHERELATRLVDIDGGTFARACTDVVTHVLAKKAVSENGKEALAGACCNSIWTLVDADAAGYVVDNVLCPLCGKHPDTIFGRTWICSHPSVVEARNANASVAVQNAALAAGDASCLFTHGILPHPSDALPPRPEGLKFQVRNHGQVMSTHSELHLSGDVYVDGSCTTHIVKELRRASFSCVALNNEGIETAVFIGAVPSSLPQTAQSAEYSAAAAAVTLAEGPMSVYGDCLNVVKHWSQAGNRRTWARQSYGGLFSETTLSGADKYLEQFVKVKAHQDIEAVRSHGSADDLQRAIGNDRADVWAKTGLALHETDSVIEARVNAGVNCAKEVCLTLAAVLPLFPATELVRPSDADRPPGESKRKKTGSWPANRKTTVRLGVKHLWVEREHRWQCSVCLSTTNNLALSKARKGESCKGRRDVATTVEQPDLGHSVVQFSVKGSLCFVCELCGGCFARNGGGKLAEPCEEPTKWGKQVLKRVFVDGVHPVSRVAFDNREDSGLLGVKVSETPQVPSVREATVRKLVTSSAKNCKQWQSKLPANAFAPTAVAGSRVGADDRDEPPSEEEDGWGSEPDDPWADPPSRPQPPPASEPDLSVAHASCSRSFVANSVGPQSGAGSSQDSLVPSGNEPEVAVLEPTSVGGFVAFSVEERTFTKSADDRAQSKVAALLERVRAKKAGSHAT
jgi:exonuclease III